MAAKNGGKTIFEKSPDDAVTTLGVKYFDKIAPSSTVSEINMVLLSHRNSRWPPKMVGKQFLGKVAR